MKQAAQKAMKAKQFNRTKLFEEHPEKFPNFETEMELINALKFARKWKNQRKWLEANNVNFEDFKEEIEFQRIKKELDLYQRASIQRLSKAI